MIKIASATAWKENLHWINDTNFNRLKDAGLVRPGKIVQAVNALKQKVPIKAIQGKGTVLGAVSYYMPTFSEYTSYFSGVDKKLLKDSIKPYRKDMGKIILDKGAAKSFLRVKRIPRDLEQDLLHHELHEAIVMKNAKKGIPAVKYHGHNSPLVPVNEMRFFNQTGGTRNRNSQVNILNLRKGTQEWDDIVQPMSENRRLRKQDYNRISKQITKKILGQVQK